jgi:hypothetical protein
MLLLNENPVLNFQTVPQPVPQLAQ